MTVYFIKVLSPLTNHPPLAKYHVASLSVNRLQVTNNRSAQVMAEKPANDTAIK